MKTAEQQGAPDRIDELPVGEGVDFVSRRQAAWETAVVLSLAVLPDWFYCYASLVWPHDGAASSYNSLALLVRSLQISAPICYFIARSGQRASDFGLVRPRWALDLSLGVGVWMCEAVFQEWAMRFAGRFLSDEHFEALATVPEGVLAAARTPAEHALSIVALAANSFAEELAMRGYLLSRFEQLLRSTWLGVLFTTVLFAGYHAYQGVGGVVCALVSGLTFAGAFCLCRRLWPVVIAHTLVNCIASWAG